jgi:hypothetical protein
MGKLGFDLARSSRGPRAFAVIARVRGVLARRNLASRRVSRAVLFTTEAESRAIHAPPLRALARHRLLCCTRASSATLPGSRAELGLVMCPRSSSRVMDKILARIWCALAFPRGSRQVSIVDKKNEAHEALTGAQTEARSMKHTCASLCLVLAKHSPKHTKHTKYTFRALTEDSREARGSTFPKQDESKKHTL